MTTPTTTAAVVAMAMAVAVAVASRWPRDPVDGAGATPLCIAAQTHREEWLWALLLARPR